MLRREIGVFPATMLGLGSIVGSGVFVSLGWVTERALWMAPVAVLIAAGVAACNGMSAAQLAASHPVSGGSYEYGHRYLSPAWGFAAGWMFLCAKSASAATAALGCAAYSLRLAGVSEATWSTSLAVVVVLLLTGVCAGGLRRSTQLNTLIVGGALVAILLVLIVAARTLCSDLQWTESWNRRGLQRGWRDLFEATALMFVAYTGYGRIATLGEEIRDPRRSIPAAILLTLCISAVLYLCVSLACLGFQQSGGHFSSRIGAASPLQQLALAWGGSWTAWVVSIGAILALLGVLLNLLLGLSRVVLAMARRNEMPPLFARLDRTRQTPKLAVGLVGVVIAGLALIGDVRWTWSFSAVTVLCYYAVTNAAALCLKSDQQLYPRTVSWCGLLGCLFLSSWVEPRVWLTVLVVLLAGFGWRLLMLRINRPDPQISNG
jgi:APA family basic amino acid/polyamine antiporter